MVCRCFVLSLLGAIAATVTNIDDLGLHAECELDETLAFLQLQARSSKNERGRYPEESKHGPPPDVLNKTLTTFFEHMAQVAFCDEPAIAAWSCSVPCEGDGFKPAMVKVLPEGPSYGMQGYVATLPEHSTMLPQTGRTRCIVGFRGSQNIRNWLADFLAVPTKLDRSWCSDCWVDDGFHNAYEELRAKMMVAILNDCKCQDIYLTGHSLGAAVATLAMFDLRATPTIRERGIKVLPAWLFGSPAVGNPQFVETLARHTLPEEYPGVYRFVNQYDIVPRLALIAYDHYGAEIFIKEASQRILYCSKPHVARCMDSVSISDLLLNQKITNHLTYFSVNFHISDLPHECQSQNPTSHAPTIEIEELSLEEVKRAIFAT